MALRWCWTVDPVTLGTTRAPVTDANFQFPNYPFSKKTGPAALRSSVMPYLLNTTQAPVRDWNFVFPVYPVTGFRRTGPSALRGGRRAYNPDLTQAPVTDTQFRFPQYPGSRITGPTPLRRKRGRVQFFWGAPSTAAFPTQYGFLSVRKTGSTIILCAVGTADAPAGMGGQLRVYKGGATYSLYLVETTDPNASPLRIQTSTGIKAVRLKT